MSDHIELRGEVIALLPKQLVKIKLPNGHELLGHFQKEKADLLNQVLPGQEIVVEVSPFDLSKGRVTTLLRRPC